MGGKQTKGIILKTGITSFRERLKNPPEKDVQLIYAS